MVGGARLAEANDGGHYAEYHQASLQPRRREGMFRENRSALRAYRTIVCERPINESAEVGPVYINDLRPFSKIT